MRRNFVFSDGKKKIFLNIRVCNPLQKVVGLMFSRKENAEALLFGFNEFSRRGIHSCFVFFPFYAVWLDDKNKIIEVRRVRPFTLLVRPKEKFFSLLEVPCNNKYSQITHFLDDIERFK